VTATPPHAVEAQRLAEQLRGQGDTPEPLFDVEPDGHAGLYWWPAPAANYGCIANLPGCTVCRPDPQPCSEFQGRWPDLWCPCCAWAAWAHVDGGAS
jgi:hypothetical protein